MIEPWGLGHTNLAATVTAQVSDEPKLKAMGFADSKTLSEVQREELWAGVQSCGYIGWAIRVIHANEISNGMLRRPAPYNLNAMSHDAAIGLVQQVLDLGVNLRYLYVDTVRGLALPCSCLVHQQTCRPIALRCSYLANCTPTPACTTAETIPICHMRKM